MNLKQAVDQGDLGGAFLCQKLGNLELVRARLGAGDQPSARLLSAALTAAERGARLTTHLLAFSRQQRLAPEPVDLNQIITGMAGLLQSAVGVTNQIEVSRLLKSCAIPPVSWPTASSFCA